MVRCRIVSVARCLTAKFIESTSLRSRGKTVCGASPHQRIQGASISSEVRCLHRATTHQLRNCSKRSSVTCAAARTSRTWASRSARRSNIAEATCTKMSATEAVSGTACSAAARMVGSTSAMPVVRTTLGTKTAAAIWTRSDSTSAMPCRVTATGGIPPICASVICTSLPIRKNLCAGEPRGAATGRRRNMVSASGCSRARAEFI